jgi:hypothetical protein
LFNYSCLIWLFNKLVTDLQLMCDQIHRNHVYEFGHTLLCCLRCDQIRNNQYYEYGHTLFYYLCLTWSFNKLVTDLKLKCDQIHRDQIYDLDEQ